MNLFDNFIIKVFANNILTNVLASANPDNHKFFIYDIPAINFLTDIILYCEYKQPKGVLDLNKIRRNPNIILETFEKRMALKPYKNLNENGVTFMDKVRAVYELFSKKPYDEYIEIFKKDMIRLQSASNNETVH